MKYMLLIYSEESAWTEAEAQSCFAQSAKLANELHEQGKCIATSPLHPVSVATSVQIRDGNKRVTDGPVCRDPGTTRRILPYRCQRS